MRTCERIGCETTLDDMRADASYCSRTCKREAARSRDLSDGSAAPGFWTAYAQIRRQKRCRIADSSIDTPLAAAA